MNLKIMVIPHSAMLIYLITGSLENGACTRSLSLTNKSYFCQKENYLFRLAYAGWR